jgi:hypothetical protein
MQERPQNYNAVEEESEATLIAPRFDASDARRAHPVVPLEETRPRAAFVNTRARLGRGVRRSWPLSLIVVALLAVGAIGGAVATKVLRRTHTNPSAQAPAETAPAQTSDAPTQPDAASVAPAPREDAGVKRQSRTTRVAREQVPAEGAGIIAPSELLRGDREDSVDEGEGRRGKGRDKRHGRDGEGDGEKEMQKALKHAKGKSPRLVDVLTNP